MWTFQKFGSRTKFEYLVLQYSDIQHIYHTHYLTIQQITVTERLHMHWCLHRHAQVTIKLASYLIAESRR